MTEGHNDLGVATDGGTDLIGPSGKDLPQPLADALDLEVPALPLDPVAQLLQPGGELGAVDGATFGGDAEQFAAVDGHPAAVPGALRHVGDHHVVVQLRVGHLAAGVLILGEARGVVAEPGSDDPGSLLVHHLVLAETPANEGHVALDVVVGGECGRFVCGLDCRPGARVGERPQYGNGLGCAEGSVDAGDVLPGGAAGDEQLTGVGVAALPDSEEVGPANRAGQPDLLGGQAVPGARVLAHQAAVAEVVVASPILTASPRQVIYVARAVDPGDLVDCHHPQAKYPPKGWNPYKGRLFFARRRLQTIRTACLRHPRNSQFLANMFQDLPRTQCTAGCNGSAISDGRCIRHLSEDRQGEEWAKLHTGSQWLDLRDAAVDAELAAKLRASAPRDDAGRYRLSHVRLDTAQIHVPLDFSGWAMEKVSFAGANFRKSPRFDDCTFLGRISFEGAQFDEEVHFNRARFEEAPSFSSTRFFRPVNFNSCVFADGTEFGSAQFSQECSFAKAVLGDGALFSGAEFRGIADFSGAQISHGATFLGTVFRDRALFADTRFGRKTNFTRTNFGIGSQFTDSVFGDEVRFSQASFSDRCGFQRSFFAGLLLFDNVTFGTDFSFSETRVEGESRWDWCRFGDRAGFVEARFVGRAAFYGAQFAPDSQLGPIVASAQVVLVGATLFRPRVMQLSAPEIVASRLSLPNGARLQIRWAEVDLSDCHFVGPTTVSTLHRPASAHGEMIDRNTVAPWREPWRARLVSLVSSDLSNLVLTDVDLAACHFMHASNMDKLKLEGSTNFAPAPRSMGWRFPREALAEEHEWRASRSHRLAALRNRGWYPAIAQPRLPRGRGRALSIAGPSSLSGMYRSLRKSREDSNNEPGAADFYCGEMEMRRLGAPVLSAERLILKLYQVVAGYGLRATVPVLLTIALILGASGFLLAEGYSRTAAPTSYGASVVQTTEAVMSVLRGSDPAGLRLRGQATIVALRVVIPVLVALAILAVRGRVKRR